MAKYRVSLMRKAGERDYRWVLSVTGTPNIATGSWLPVAEGKARTYRGALLKARIKRRLLDCAAAREARRPYMYKTFEL